MVGLYVQWSYKARRGVGEADGELQQAKEERWRSADPILGRCCGLIGNERRLSIVCSLVARKATDWSSIAV